MSGPKISRRKFLKYSSLAIGAGYVGLKAHPASGWGDGGGSHGGSNVIDPPPGGPFTDPVEMGNISTTPGVVEVNVVAARSPVGVDGTTANLLTYNATHPAPTIRVRRGDTLRINFTNSLPDLGTNILGHDRSHTNLHTHGLHVSPSGNADNILRLFMRGDSGLFEYDLANLEPGALCFYHPHVHGTVTEQMWGGLAGALVVEDDTNALSGYETHLMVLKDLALVGANPEPYTSMDDFEDGKEGGIVMVNGKVNPVLPIRPGQVQRWRAVNASNARFFRLSLEGHTLHLVGTDGGLVDKPYALSEILLSPGERVDILVRADQPSNSYRLLSLPYDRGGANRGQQVTLLTLSYQGSPTSQDLPVSVNPDAVRINPSAIAKTERLTLSMRRKASINGISFTADPVINAHVIRSIVGTHEIWEISNRSGMDHPFHQHVNPCQVLSIDGGNSGYASLYSTIPAWKDTVIVPRWGRATILIPVLHYTGTTVFHCHIIEHEDMGMMGVWEIT